MTTFRKHFRSGIQASLVTGIFQYKKFLCEAQPAPFRGRVVGGCSSDNGPLHYRCSTFGLNIPEVC